MEYINERVDTTSYSIDIPMTVKQDKQIIDQIRLLEKSIITLQELEGALRNRLEPIILVRPAQLVDESKEDMPYLCPLAENLRGLRHKLEDSISNLSRILDEIEL